VLGSGNSILDVTDICSSWKSRNGLEAGKYPYPPDIVRQRTRSSIRCFPNSKLASADFDTGTMGGRASQVSKGIEIQWRNCLSTSSEAALIIWMVKLVGANYRCTAFREPRIFCGVSGCFSARSDKQAFRLSLWSAI
jgi:hypothetical protein